ERRGQVFGRQQPAHAGPVADDRRRRRRGGRSGAGLDRGPRRRRRRRRRRQRALATVDRPRTGTAHLGRPVGDRDLVRTEGAIRSRARATLLARALVIGAVVVGASCGISSIAPYNPDGAARTGSGGVAAGTGGKAATGGQGGNLAS